MQMRRESKGRGRCTQATVSKLRQANLQSSEKPTLKECLFNPSVNPAINILKRISYILMVYYPDFIGMEGWKKWIRKLVTIFLILYLGTTLIFEGYTFEKFVYKTLIMSGAAFLIWANYTGLMIYSFLEKWEAFGAESSKEKI